MWVSALMRARAELFQAQLGVPELVDIETMEATAHQLEAMWKEAKESQSVLCWSLLEVSAHVCVARW